MSGSESCQRPLVMLGVGRVAFAVARLVGGERRVTGTTRSPDRAEQLEAAGIEPIVVSELTDDAVAPLVRGTDLLVSFPPDGRTDRAIAPACREAHGIVYISSTAVYGEQRGMVDETTPAAPSDERGRARLEAEREWLEAGAKVLRAPGIYGPGFGLHRALAEGRYLLSGDGSNVISRIHVEDLARFVLAALASSSAERVFVVGDARPTPQGEVVQWLCDRMQLPPPERIPLEQAPRSLRGGRAVDSGFARRALGVVLKHPSYREGFEACLAAELRAPEGEP